MELMLDLAFIREHPDVVAQAIADKGEKGDVEGVLALDRERRSVLHELEQLRKLSNEASEEIARAKKAGENATARIEEMRSVSRRIKEMEGNLREVEGRLEPLLLMLPNVPDPSVRRALGEENNEEVRTFGRPRTRSFEPKDHVELGRSLGILDTVTAGKLAGSGFYLTRGAGARLERALINFMLDLHTTKHGYTEIVPPVLANRATMQGTGQIPKLEEDMYRLEKDDLFLIPTAEVPLTNLHQGEILDGDDLPLRFTATTSCFRREAGAAGKDTSGMMRVHQFHKVEMVKIVRAEDETARQELEGLLADAEEVLQALEIPYRVLRLCTGDLSFASRITYDLEAHAPGGGGRWLEVSSCSEFGDFQARRCGTRYRGADGKVRYVRTLNGSGLAIPRTWICLVENFQREDGSVEVPEALVPYMGGMREIGP
jgi:seryl-tRNA synthetase